MSQGASPGAGQPESQQKPHAIFISYSTEDQAIADAVVEALEAEKIGCWIAPRDVQDGRPYSGQITQAIREARILLLILTGASNRSKHVLREVERAARCRNHLLTFRIQPIAPGDDLTYFLGADQWVDGFKPLPPSQHFPVLVQRIRKLLERSAVERESAAQPETAPEKFAHFRILRHPDGSLFKLGKGGMAVTYKAIDTTLNRPVALKVIAAEQLNSPQAKHRFLREAQSAALIHHPHVATIFHFGEEAGAYFYAMEYVEGEDLERHVVRHGPLSPATALRVALQVAQALEAAQARHLIHRDIKPANIMAVPTRAGTIDVKLIDFGLAKGADAESLEASRITRTQDFVGSPAFASPEQCETKKLDIRSDIYSLGVTLWYLLSGKRPFVGTVGEVMVAQIIKPPPFEHLIQTPEPVVALLRRTLEKKPEDRYQTPEELQQAIENVSRQLSEGFDSVPDRISLQPLLDGDPGPPKTEEEIEPVVLGTAGSSKLDTYLRVEVGALLSNRYRLLSEESEGNCGRLFRARDEQAGPGQPSEVAVKLLHPGIANNEELLDLLENELGVVRRQAHSSFIGYYRLNRETRGPYLVREWVHGFLLYDLVRWRRSLKAEELPVLLDSLASTLDFVTNEGLGLVEVSVRKLFVACPADIDEFEALAKGNSQHWSRCTLKLNPLCLAPLLFRSRNGWDRQTIVPTSRVLSMSQAQAGIRGTKAVRLYGRLVYELVSGRALRRGGDPQKYAPLPELGESTNKILRRACVSGESTYGNCQDFWNALKENITSAGRAADTVVRPLAPTTPSVVPGPPPATSSPKRALLIGTILAGITTVVTLVILGTIRFGGPSTKSLVVPTPTAIVLATPRSPISSTTPSAIPTKSSSALVASTPKSTPIIVLTPPAPVVTATPTPVPTESSSPLAASTPKSTPIVVATPPAPIVTATKTAVPPESQSPPLVATSKRTPVISASPPVSIPKPTPSTRPALTFTPTPALSPANTTFDGIWSVTLSKLDYKDPSTGAFAQGFTIHFPATVKNGVLHGERGIRGMQRSLELNGRIAADGSATLHVNGIRGPERYNMPAGGQSHGRAGTSYTMEIAAQFKGRRGRGKESTPRPATLDFVKD
jgi:serine/threonine protein kinase